MVGETDRRRYHMAETVNLVTKPLAVRRVEAVKLGGQTHADIKVEHIVESLRRIAHQLVVHHVPRLVNTLEVHLVAEANLRRDSQVLKQREVGANRHIVGDTVLPVFGKVGVEEVTLLAGYGVGERTVVAHLNLLVPALFTDGILALEGIDTTHIHRQAWCRNGQSRVLCSLGNRGVDADVPRAVGKTLRIVDG